MVRQPIVAGKFYQSDFDRLDKQISDCYESRLGPGALPVRRDQKRNIKAIIVPHAGYYYSGACAAWAYKELAESRFPKTYILLGPSHMGFISGISSEDWNTPFGIVRSDKEIISLLEKKTSLSINDKIHYDEHSIEVQLPMLQFISKDRLPLLRTVPMMIGRDIDYGVVAQELHDCLLGIGDIIFIVSSDFTHYGRQYGYIPFSSDTSKNIKRLDDEAIGYIKGLDYIGFERFIRKTGATICGYMPILVLLKYLSLEKPEPVGHLLMHYTSSDISGDYSNSVSYASIIFR